MGTDLELRVVEALAEDIGKGWARLAPEDIKELNGVLGDLIEIKGPRTTVARITGTFPEHLGKKVIQIDGLTRSNGEVSVGELVRVRKLPRRTADTVLITPVDFNSALPEEHELDHFAKVLQGLPVMPGDKINVPFLGGKERLFLVEATAPPGGVIINQKSQFVLKKPDFCLEGPSRVSNREDLLDPALMRAGRLDYILQFPIPDEKERLEIFDVHTQKRPLGRDVSLAELAKLTDGLVGSQIAFICKSATMMAISEVIGSREKKSQTELSVAARHFREAVKATWKREEPSLC